MTHQIGLYQTKHCAQNQINAPEQKLLYIRQPVWRIGPVSLFGWKDIPFRNVEQIEELFVE